MPVWIAPDDPLPPVDELVRARASFSRSFIEEVRRAVHLERLPMTEKAPLITTAEDTVLGLNDVLHSDGALRLTGSNLHFRPKIEDEECLIKGTRSGSQVQTRFVLIANSEVTFLPAVPAQDDPWNNEYLVSIAARYTENGTLRTGIYRRRLRTPLAVSGFGHPNMEVGILTGSATAPYVIITDGTVSADETLRIQVILDLHEGSLAFNLMDLNEDGQAGEDVTITADGAYTLPGFDGSALTGLNLTVNSYDDLVKMIRSGYSGRLVDVLELKQGS
jgi:hypothetical protein